MTIVYICITFVQTNPTPLLCRIACKPAFNNIYITSIKGNSTTKVYSGRYNGRIILKATIVNFCITTICINNMAGIILEAAIRNSNIAPICRNNFILHRITCKTAFNNIDISVFHINNATIITGGSSVTVIANRVVYKTAIVNSTIKIPDFNSLAIIIQKTAIGNSNTSIF